MVLHSVRRWRGSPQACCVCSLSRTAEMLGGLGALSFELLAERSPEIGF